MILMHIAIDIREACKPRRTGKGQWVFGFFSELLRRGLPITAYTDRPLPHEMHLEGTRTNIQEYSVRGLRWHFAVSRDLRRLPNVSVYVSPTSYLVPFLLRGRVATVPVVHDLIAFRSEEHHERRATWIERATLGRTVRSAAHILTVSASTKSDLLARYPLLSTKKVTPVFAGPMHEHPRLSQADGKTILCIATLCPRKNQRRLIEAYRLLDSGLQQKTRLLLVGARGWQDAEIVSLAQSTPGVEWRDYVSDAVYEELLQTCAIFALPSLYEGFGMQLLDALQRGIPVLTSDRGSLREVCGNAAHYVNPEDVSSIAAGLDLLLRNSRVRLDLSDRAPGQARQFSWERTVDLALQALRHCEAIHDFCS